METRRAMRELGGAEPDRRRRRRDAARDRQPRGARVASSEERMTDETNEGLSGARAEAERRGVGGYGRHVFICTGPDCTTPEEGLAAWTRLKRAVGDLNAQGDDEPPIYRTKVGCLRICESGPVAVVYPEGRWYAGLTPEGPRSRHRGRPGTGAPGAGAPDRREPAFTRGLAPRYPLRRAGAHPFGSPLPEGEPVLRGGSPPTPPAGEGWSALRNCVAPSRLSEARGSLPPHPRPLPREREPDRACGSFAKALDG